MTNKLTQFFSSPGRRRDFLRRSIAGLLGGSALAGPLTPTSARARTPVRSAGTDPFVAEIAIFPFNFAPKGYAFCDGQLLPISGNTALFSLLGTTYGGNGETTFGLPDLRGCVPLGWGQGPGLSLRDLGEKGGLETVTLISSEIPSHSHSLLANSGAGTSNNPSGRMIASNAEGIGQFGGAPGTNMHAESLSPTGGGQPHDNLPPYLTLNYCIATNGIFPSRSTASPQPDPVPLASSGTVMSTPYVGEIKLFAGNFEPAGWMFCAGQLLPISENETLFALIGTTFGGDGQTTFALPNLSSRVPIGAGQGPGLSNRVLSETGGSEEVTLTVNQIPSHSHTLRASSQLASSDNPAGRVLAANAEGVPQFNNAAADATMHSSSIGSTGGSQPHGNMPPFLGLNYIISLFGVFPSPT